MSEVQDLGEFTKGEFKLPELSNNKNNLKTMIRIVIVFLSWGVTMLKPDSTTGFFQNVFIASVTSMYEYGIFYLETNTKFKRIIGITGLILSILYMLFAVMGFAKLVNLDTTSSLFSFGKQMPFPHPESICWSYYITVWIMLVFPLLVFLELFNKSNESTSPHRATQRVGTN